MNVGDSFTIAISLHCLSLSLGWRTRGRLGRSRGVGDGRQRVQRKSSQSGHSTCLDRLCCNTTASPTSASCPKSAHSPLAGGRRVTSALEGRVGWSWMSLRDGSCTTTSRGRFFFTSQSPGGSSQSSPTFVWIYVLFTERHAAPGIGIIGIICDMNI